MSFLFDDAYYKVGKSGISPAQNMAAYLGGSAIQTVGDNPVTAYRQLVQQYAKALDGTTVDPKVAEFCMRAADFSGCVKTMTKNH